MQLESHATPTRESPQQRYANLHRAIERGLDSDEVWKELAEVSLRIGHGDEAVRCTRRIRNDATRFALESRLTRLGLMEAHSAPRPAAQAATAEASPAHPADEHSLQDHLSDAFQYLFHQHMPWLVLLTTLAFPLVVGVGGFLTAGGSPLLLTAIAALPGLCVLSLVGAMGRQILIASAEGNGDVPAVPGFSELALAARAFLNDAVLVLGSLLGPSLIALWLGAPLASTLPGLAIGAFFVPMAWGLRHLHGDWNALSPVTLARAVARSGFGYAAIAGVCCSLFLPAIGVAWFALRSPVWVQIASVGPLCVLPLFLTSRLLGTWLDVKRVAIGGVRQAAKAKSQATPAKPAAAPKAKAPAARRATAAPAAGGPTPRPVRRPESLEHFRAPVVGKKPVARAAAAPAAPAAPTAPTASAAPAAAAKGAPRSIEGRGPAARPADARPATPPPGRVVAKGKDRERLGASAKRS